MSTEKHILVVDDEQKNILVLESMLVPLGHKVTSATNGSEALAKVKEDPPDLILLDVMMPDLNGFTVCKLLKANEETRLIPVILVTALSEVSDRVKGFESDADDFLTKPVNRHELIARVRSCLRIKSLNDQLENSDDVLYAFARAVEAKDPYTIGHSERVARFATDLGLVAGLSQDQLTELKRGGLLHDIGKIGVPDALLGKPGKLTKEEFQVIQQHPVIGEEICQSLKSFVSILPLIRSHHERLDGSGYPDGLKGDEIPFIVQILSVSDSFEAMTSDRPYRSGLPIEKVERIFLEEVDRGHFDRELVRLAFERFPFWTEECSGMAKEKGDKDYAVLPPD